MADTGYTPENPPAFPHTGDRYHDEQDGMTLRDWFAGQAVGHLAAKIAGARASSALIAGAAYDVADAMLATREGNKQ